MLDLVYLLICTTGLVPDPEHCAVYELRPQYEMTQAMIDEKVDRICEMAYEATAKYDGQLTKCEVIDEDEKFEFDATGSRFFPVPTTSI